MRAFYDKQLPMIANKIGKKFGAKVEDTAVQTKPEVPFDQFSKEARANFGEASPERMREMYEQYGREQTAQTHSIAITPQMRDSVMKGQPLFSPRMSGDEPGKSAPEEIIYRDEVSNLIQSVTGEGGEQGAHPAQGKMGRGDGGGPGITERNAAKVAEAGLKTLTKNLNFMEEHQSIFPATLASLDEKSARLWRAWTARNEEGAANVERLKGIVHGTLVQLPAEARDRVYAAIELARRWNWRPPDDGKLIRVKNSSYWQAQKSKVGDDYVLSAPETRAFHDTMKLGDEGWQTFINALAKREGWNGPADPKAITAAAVAAGEGLPEGKRLLRLAAAITEAQASLNRPYFPAMRFGDLFIAVKPKAGVDPESAGGYPEVKWFETVERGAMRDAMGLNRMPVNEVKAVQEAIARIRAMKDSKGEVAFPADKYDIETGDLKTKPSILKSLNIPAIEKLFMLMERGVTHSLRDKVIAEGGRDEGLEPGETAALKEKAKSEAAARYKALLGDTKDTLMDAIYQDLMAGFKKPSKLVPGYSSDFDRAIGTHIGQIGRNAADVVHRNSIEQAFQDIQDNHEHIAVKHYWTAWRKSLEDPQTLAQRLTSTAARYGAAYTMALNPMTTGMMMLHTPMMAIPVMSIGTNVGRASYEMTRGLGQAYRAIQFDTTHGASIDVTKLGNTPREKAFLAELDRVDLLHSIGADDVRSINDRQAGLFGTAAPLMRRGMDMAMSNISAADQANRAATALAAFRMAMDPARLREMAKPWMEHNAIFRDMVKNEGLTPETFARFMLDQAAGTWGKTNQAPMMRGVEGSLVFTMHGFQTRYLSNAWRLMNNMGLEGKIAAAWMMAGLAAGAGAFGLPFVEDGINAGEKLWKMLMHTDPMIEAHIGKFLKDAGFGKIGAEMIMRGPVSVALGADLGSRMGFGNVVTNFLSSAEQMGTIPSIIGSRLIAAQERSETEQGPASVAAEFLPSALRNPARAAIEAQQGSETAAGKMVMPRSQITTADSARRALGVPSLAGEENYQQSSYLSRLSTRDKELHEVTTRAAGNLLMRADEARTAGDKEGALKLQQRMSVLLSDYNKQHPAAPVTAPEIRNIVFQMQNPEMYQRSKMPKMLVPEVAQSPYR